MTLFVLSCSVLVWVVGFSWFFTLFTLVYPCWCSILALEIKKTAPDDDKFWISYWILFGVFKVHSYLLHDLMSMIIPVYWLFEHLFLLYLMLPQTKGALVIYYSILRPLS